jgi:hypothetical protein
LALNHVEEKKNKTNGKENVVTQIIELEITNEIKSEETKMEELNRIKSREL